MGHPLATKRRQRLSLVLACFAIVSLAAAAVIISRVPVKLPPQDRTSTKQQTTSPPVSSRVLGAHVTAQQYTLSVTSISLSQIDVSSQSRRAAVGVSITNTSNTVLQLSPGLQMTLTDRRGTIYPFTAEYQPDTVLGGPVQPGSTSTLVADFKLPAEATPGQFIFQSDASIPASKVEL